MPNRAGLDQEPELVSAAFEDLIKKYDIWLLITDAWWQSDGEKVHLSVAFAVKQWSW